MRSWNCPVPPLTVFQISAAFLFFSSISLHLFLLFILPQRPQRLPGQREQHHEVEHGHQSDADIAEVPDDCVGLKTADKQHDQGEDLIKSLIAPAVSEEVCHVGTRIEQDPEECLETEQCQRDGDKDHSELPHIVAHDFLEKVHSCESHRQFLRDKQHDHRRAAADHDRIDKYA